MLGRRRASGKRLPAGAAARRLGRGPLELYVRASIANSEIPADFPNARAHTREAVLYREAGVTPRRFLREDQVIERVDESDVAVSLRLVPSDETPAPAFRPGQYVSIQVDVRELGLRQLRQYSLSDAADGRSLRITVKRELGDARRPQGAVSTHLMRHAHVGSRWLLSPPFGDLALDTHAETPVVMISAGVGVTPMMAMRNHLVGRRRGGIAAVESGRSRRREHASRRRGVLRRVRRSSRRTHRWLGQAHRSDGQTNRRLRQARRSDCQTNRRLRRGHRTIGRTNQSGASTNRRVLSTSQRVASASARLGSDASSRTTTRASLARARLVRARRGRQGHPLPRAAAAT